MADVPLPTKNPHTDPPPPVQKPKDVVCATCTPGSLECARLKLKINKHVTLYNAYSKIASGKMGKRPTMFRRGTISYFNEADQAEFAPLAKQEVQSLKGLLEEYKNKGCDPKRVLEARKIVHNYKPPVPQGVIDAGKKLGGKGIKKLIKRVPLAGEFVGDALDAVNDAWEQNDVPF